MTIETIIKLLLINALGSLQIFCYSLIGALILGVLVCFLRMRKFFLVRLITQFYISVMRGTPLMLQLFVVFFGPGLAFGVSLGSGYKFIAILIAFILNYAAYYAEIYRSGLVSIPQGQYEAANVLGYSHLQTFFRVILPQVVKRILPAMSNEVISLVKDTSLAFTLGFAEMFSEAQNIVSNYANLWAFVIAAAVYYLFNLLIAFIMNRGEKKLSYYHE
ncbi:MAG: amino acid ABC transporter permease [Coriobacteriales bacterium]|nr:amino acid ABC transporter permease [Coriobacteriales bacterium]